MGSVNKNRITPVLSCKDETVRLSGLWRTEQHWSHHMELLLLLLALTYIWSCLQTRQPSQSCWGLNSTTCFRLKARLQWPLRTKCIAETQRWSDVLIDFNLSEGPSFAHVQKLVNSRSATGAEESDINNRIRYKIAFTRSCRIQVHSNVSGDTSGPSCCWLVGVNRGKVRSLISLHSG